MIQSCIAFGQTCRSIEREVSGILYLHFLRSSFLSSDKHDSFRSPCTIDSGRSGILQNRDCFNILWVYRIDISRHSINDHQCAGTVHRSVASYLKRGKLSGLACTRSYRQSGYGALQGIGRAAYRTVLDDIRIDSLHSTCQIHFLLSSITHYNNFIQQLRIFFYLYFQHRPGDDFYFWCRVTDIRNHQPGTGIYIQGEITVEIGYDTIGSSLLQYTGANDRFTGHICNITFHLDLIRLLGNCSLILSLI